MGLNVDPTTIIRALKKRGIYPRVPARKVYLSDEHVRLRMIFAETFDNMGEEFWDYTVISDEKTWGLVALKSVLLVFKLNVCCNA